MNMVGLLEHDSMESKTTAMIYEKKFGVNRTHANL
jgi:hypothetical protein